MDLIQFKYLAKQNYASLITAIVDIILVLGSLIILETKSAALVSVIIIVVSIVVLVRLNMTAKTSYYLPLKNQNEEHGWIGRGDWEYDRTENAFFIANSNLGYIFSKTLLWDDYSLCFEFKIIDRCCGWVVRADGLSSYLMLQCTTEAINPHIRIDGTWLNEKQLSKKFTHNNKLESHKWYKAKLTCDKRLIKFKIWDLLTNNEISTGEWEIPTTIIIPFKTSSGEKLLIKKEIEFDFGAFGFRDHPSEKAYIRKIEANRMNI